MNKRISVQLWIAVATLSVALPGIACARGFAVLGTVQSGATPIVGSNVTVYAAGSGAVTTLASAVTDASGKFSASIDPVANGLVIYVQAKGGSVGAIQNPAIDLVNVLGLASDIGHHNVATVNELTTAAAAWALARFISGGAISGPSPALQSASATVANLVDSKGGDDAGFLTSGANSPNRLNTVANIIAACVSTPAQCSTLFTQAAPPVAGSVAPTDTLEAAVDIARNPANNVGALFSLVSATFNGTPPYTPSLAAAPSDYTIGLNFTGGGLNVPESIAIDAANNVWVANLGANNVIKISPDGTFLSGHNGFGSALNNPTDIAIDAAGNAWVANLFGNTVAELTPTGNPVAGSPFTAGDLSGPISLTFDTSGNIWIANSPGATTGSVTEYPLGNPANALNFAAGGFSGPRSIATDPFNDVWVTNFNGSSVTVLNSSGTPISSTPFPAGPSPSGIAIDPSGNAWITNFLASTVTELTSAAQPAVGSPFLTGAAGNPRGVAIDGAGNVWVANDAVVGSVTELAGAQSDTPGSALSPAGGFTGGTTNNEPYELAIDQAGNVWISNSNFNGTASGQSSLTELVGAAVPVKTPLAGPASAP